MVFDSCYSSNVDLVNSIIYNAEFYRLRLFTEIPLEKVLLPSLFENCKDQDVYLHLLENALDLNCVITYIGEPEPSKQPSSLSNVSLTYISEHKYYTKPINLMCRLGFLGCVVYLLQKDIDLNYSALCDTPLMELCKSPNPEHYNLITKILAKNADVNIMRKGWTALTYASYYSEPNTIKLLLKNGADKNHRVTSLYDKHCDLGVLDLCERNPNVDMNDSFIVSLFSLLLLTN